MSENRVIVIDPGTSTTTYGFAGASSPQGEITTIIGKLKPTLMRCNSMMPTELIGDDAMQKRSLMTFHHPIVNGKITDWQEMKKILSKIFSELEATGDESVIFTQPITADKYYRKQISELLFDHANVTFHFQPVLSLHSYGLSTGFIVEMGSGITQLAPIYENELIEHAAQSFAVTGNKLTAFMTNLLNEIEHVFTTPADAKKVEEIMQQFCFVAMDYEIEKSLTEQVTYRVNDDVRISFSNEKCLCPEALFNPSHIDLCSQGLHKAIYESIIKCDNQIQEDLFKSIVLTGGCSKFTGLQARLEKELRNLTDFEIRVVNHSHPKSSSWIGGSMHANN